MQAFKLPLAQGGFHGIGEPRGPVVRQLTTVLTLIRPERRTSILRPRSCVGAVDAPELRPFPCHRRTVTGHRQRANHMSSSQRRDWIRDPGPRASRAGLDSGAADLLGSELPGGTVWAQAFHGSGPSVSPPVSPVSCLLPFFLLHGACAGDPMDAVLAAKFRRRNLCTRVEGECLLTFTNPADRAWK